MLFAVVGCILTIYISVSCVLLRYPLARFRKRGSLLSGCTHVSHRGGSCENVENTIAAFDHAISCNTDMLEMDCHMTADGVIVVVHDAELSRLAHVDRRIDSFEFNKLPRLATDILLDFEFYESFKCNVAADRRIPTLREVMERYPGVLFNIDPKAVEDRELIAGIYELIREFKRENYTVVGSSRHRTASLCYATNNDVPIAFSSRRVFTLVFFYFIGLLPFVPIHETCLEIPMPSAFARSRLALRLSKPHLFLSKCFSRLFCSPGFIQHLRRRNIQVFPWVLNTEEQWREAFAFGATGVMTDYPLKLRTFLDANPNIQRQFV